MKGFLLLAGLLQFASARTTRSGSTADATTATSATNTTTTSSQTSSSPTIGGPIHTVAVGANGFMYVPNTTYANVGDTVVFDFYPTNHSVIRGEWSGAEICGAAGCNPCVPYELYHPDESKAGFFSSNELVDSFTNRKQWNLTINTTDPIFFYCSALESCTPNGMVGVINPPNASYIQIQHEKAMVAAYELSPGQSWPAEGSTSSSGSDKKSSTSLSGGAIAGIVVGGVAFVAVCAALTFYVGRSRTYGKVFRHSQPPTSDLGDSSVAGAHPWFNAPSRFGSPPPPPPPPPMGSPPPPMGSPPPPMGSPPLGSEKDTKRSRWSDSTSLSHMNHPHRMGSPGPQEGQMFVGYNRQTGAPEFAPELPGDNGIMEMGGGMPMMPPPQTSGRVSTQETGPVVVVTEAETEAGAGPLVGASPAELEATNQSRWYRNSRAG